MKIDEKKVVKFLEGHVGEYWTTNRIARLTGAVDYFVCSILYVLSYQGDLSACNTYVHRIPDAEVRSQHLCIADNNIVFHINII